MCSARKGSRGTRKLLNLTQPQLLACERGGPPTSQDAVREMHVVGSRAHNED